MLVGRSVMLGLNVLTFLGALFFVFAHASNAVLGLLLLWLSAIGFYVTLGGKGHTLYFFFTLFVLMGEPFIPRS